jgi:hypothetical protein
VVLVIRAGALAPAELAADPLATPRLRRLLTEGSSLPAISLARDRSPDVGGGDGGGRTAASIALDTLLPPEAIAHLRAQGISMVTVDPIEVAVAARPAAGEERPPLTQRQAAVRARLHELIGEPPAVNDEERATVRRFREILGLGGASGPRDGGPGGDGLAPADRSDPVVERVRGALDKGARLVVLLERVDTSTANGDNGGTGSGPAERDRLLGEVLDEVHARSGASALLLSLPEGGLGLLVASGPKVRPGWIVPERFPLEDVAPTLLWLLGSTPIDGGSRRDPIDEILRQ